ncbi:MAG: hypothetical protein KDE04_05670 [Anaerolineales bacterium]|nr:hypothetical protein [Anaerolineales bacterium]
MQNQQHWGSRTGLFFGLLLLVLGLILALIWMQVPVDATDNRVEPANVTGSGGGILYLPIAFSPPEPILPAWLDYLNLFRDLGNVNPLVENSDWSNGGWLHGRYMVKNDVITHSEDPGNPWYTPEGNAAAQNGNVAVFSSAFASDEMAIDLWMTGPFHAIGILDPQLHTTGFGSYREADGGWQTGATLDVSRGQGGVPAGTNFPLPFPRPNGETWLTEYGGNEWPDPLTSCAGYSAPSGPPIMIQLGSGNVTPNVTNSSFMRGSTNLSHCVFDETDYNNPDSNAQSVGRLVLNARDAIVIIPQAPLTAGTYTASVTVNGNTHTWTFTVIMPPTGSGNDGSDGTFNGR